MILGHLQINFVVINVLLVFKKGPLRIFSFSTYAKNCIFLWHHTLNQHIHIDTMYPFGRPRQGKVDNRFLPSKTVKVSGKE